MYIGVFVSSRLHHEKLIKVMIIGNQREASLKTEPALY